jgi:membrane protease YdiL (CAAX protease family)
LIEIDFIAAAIYLGLRFVIFRKLLAIKAVREAPWVILAKWALQLIVGAGVALGLLTLTLLPGIIGGYFTFMPGTPDAATAAQQGSIYPMLALSALREELVYRGIVLLLLIVTLGYMLFALIGPKFLRSRGVQAALWINGVIISSALFSFAHADNPSAVGTALVNIFLVGLMLSLMFLYTRGLTMAFGFHFAWNALLEVVNLPVSGYEFSSSWHPFSMVTQGAPLITGGNFGPEASAVLTALLVAANLIGIVVYALRKPRKVEPSEGDAGSEPPLDDAPSQG